jgi:hypothetical protein
MFRDQFELWPVVVLMVETGVDQSWRMFLV